MSHQYRTVRDAQPAAPLASVAGVLAEHSPTALLDVLLGITLITGAVHWLITMFADIVSRAGAYDFAFYYAWSLTLRLDHHANIYDERVVQAVAQAHHLFLPAGVLNYPPLLPILLIPLTYLSFGTAQVVWLCFNFLVWLACALLVAAWMMQSLRTGAPSEEPQAARSAMRRVRASLAGLVGAWLNLPLETRFALAAGAWLTFEYAPFAQSVGLGQISGLILLLVLLAGLLERRGHPVAAGALLAVAAFIKVFPALLIVYYLIRRRWRVVVSALVVSTGILIGMAAVVGVNGLLNAGGLLANGTADSQHFQNEALARVPMWLAVLFGGKPSTTTTMLGYLLIGIVGVVFLAGTWLGARRRGTPMGVAGSAAPLHLTELAGYSWALCTMVLASPITWEHHDVWLLPAIAACLGIAAQQLANGRRLATGGVTPAVWCALAAAACYAMTSIELPFSYDYTPAIDLTLTFLHHPVRPLFMLLRPVGTTLLWVALAYLYLRTSRQAGAVGSNKG